MGEWLIKTINYRQNTLLKVAKAILEFQDDFFSKGEAYLKPMLLKDIAPLLGVNISTICRACMGKYVQTPKGLFELKYFFSAKGKEETNADNIKKMIRELISKEDPRYPFSDQQLLQILQEKGIQVARRTLAKYRELMNIPTSSQRKNSRNS
jgi:RNA polymerase sigma-54 factor